MWGKFNVTRLSERDDILLGKPWLSAMKPDIDWGRNEITMLPTPRSRHIENLLNKIRRRNGVTPYRFEGLRPMIEDEEEAPFKPLKSLPLGTEHVLEEIRRKKKKKKTKKAKPAKEVPAEEKHFEMPQETDVMEDVWVGKINPLPEVKEVATYPLTDDEILIEYSADGSSVRLIENLTFDTPLTRDGTSKTETTKTKKTPLRNIWILATAKEEYTKTSNKAQEFAKDKAQETKKKPFEELVPEYLHDFADIFAKDGLNKLPPSRPGVDHRIETKEGFIPKSSRAYPLSPKETEAVKAFLDEHIQKDFIQPSKSPQASGFFFVGKKDGSLRPCQDYRYINEWTIKNAYPLPLIPPLIAKLKDAKYFTKVDVRSGYNNILIHPDDRWKAAFSTTFGLFEPKVMFFGLCNSPATFQAYMNQTFSKEIDEGWLIVYMDDILIFSSDLAEHQMRTRRVLEKLRQEQLFLKPEKCTFDSQEVEYLGMIIRPGQVAMDPAKLKGISEWQTPSTVKEVRSFLGFCNFYRHFISHYSDLARPLLDLTKKDTVFSWSTDCEASFLKLKQCFTTEPVLRNPDPSRQFALATDASLFATGAVLLQTDDNGSYHPCGYLSQSLNAAERNYQIYDRELLAVIRALKAWRHFLEGNPHPVIVFTDHKNLLYFRSSQTLTRRQARWQLTLCEYDLQFHHVPGSKLAAPDALSRRPDHDNSDRDNEDVVLLPDSLFVKLIDTALASKFKAANDNPADLTIKTAADALNGLCAPPMKSALSDWRMDEGILYFKDRAYVPPDLRKRILELHHDHPTAGHPGRSNTEWNVKKSYWWPGMGTFIRQYVDGCTMCQQMKSDTHPTTPPLMPIPSTCTRPFSQVSVDLITDLPESAGYDSIMVVVDHGLTKGVIFSPCKKTITAEGVAELFYKKVFMRFGLYDKIISDRGPQFASKLAKELGRLLDYQVALSTAYHPQTDGQTERMNQELETYLRIYCRTTPNDWAKHLPMAEFVHNSRRHSARNASPFYLMMGYEPKGIPYAFPDSALPAAEDRVKKLAKIREEALACHSLAQQRMAERTFGRKYQPWKVGDKVWLSAAHLITHFPSKKLAPKRYGPFTVKQVLSPITFTLELPATWRVHPTFHASELSSYQETDVHGPNYTEPPPDLIDGEEHYEIEAILQHRGTGTKRRYLVSWVGYPPSERTWIPEKDLKSAAEMLKDYKKRLKLTTKLLSC